jgi:hypothetical protein
VRIIPVDDLDDLLIRAVAMVPPGPAVATAQEYLAVGEPGLAVDFLADLDPGWQTPPTWWDLLTGAADLMRMRDTAAWCRWGRRESVHGTIRASLHLTEGGPIPGRGIARLLWDIGQADPRAARVWVEFAPSLAPGATGSVRLAPLTPADWRDLRPGSPIAVHDRPRLVATGTILEVTAR